MRGAASMLLLWGMGCFSSCEASPTKLPNIILLLTDDQDVMLGSSDRHIIPQITRILGDQGVTMKNMFATTPVCCPSRSTLVTGRHLHNIPMTNNSAQGNCSSFDWQQGPEKDTIAVHLEKAGYHTAYFGKYLNLYGENCCGGLQHVPPGWSTWSGLQGNSRYYNYSLSINGKEEKHADNYADDYLPDLITNRSIQLIQQEPLFLVLAPPSCHDPTEPAPQHAGMFANHSAPRTPIYDKDNQDKSWFVKTYGGSMTAPRQQVSDFQYRRRLETLQSIDAMVERVWAALEDKGLAEETYFFYSADHGFHLGEFGMLKDKRTLYDFDLRVPGFVRGPGIARGSNSSAVFTLMDLAPTFLDIAGLPPHPNFDGKSLLPALLDQSSAPPSAAAAAAQSKVGPSRTFLVEYFGESGANPGPVCSGLWQEGVSCYIEGPEMSHTAPKYAGPTECSCQDASANTYACLRTLNATDDQTFCEFVDGFTEFYDLHKDVWQATNAAKNLPPARDQALRHQLAKMKKCKGSSECVVSY